MTYFRIFLTVIIPFFLMAQPGNAQDTNTTTTSPNVSESAEVKSNKAFHFVPEGKDQKNFRDAVTEHIVSNKGIQDFYSIPAVETQWLNKIIKSENQWHIELQKLEQDYRKAFQRRVELKSGQNDRAVRIENYTTTIVKLEKDIADIRRQIVQINVDQQVYINSLNETPVTTLLAIKTLYTADLLSVKEKLDVLNNSIFGNLKEPALAHVAATYGKTLNIPFQAGYIRVTYMYPENITHFDSQANEHVYLFLRVEAFPFSPDVTDNIETKGVNVKILENPEQVMAYLKTEEVGDKRLHDWLIKELDYQKLNNSYLLNIINGRLDDFNLFRKGLKHSITELSANVQELAAKRDSVIGSGNADKIEADYKLAKKLYHRFYTRRNVLTQEKYTLENDVMFSLFHIEGESSKNKKRKKQKKMLESTIAANIPISGRPLKDVFTDILITANKKRKLNLQNYRERIYNSNLEQTELIQGVLEWKVANEEFKILKLTRGNVGSRSHFVVHLAKRTELHSKPGFPSPKNGVCKATLLYKRGKDVMRNSSKTSLAELEKCLRKFPQQIIQITGHTDPLKPNYGEGSKYSNVTLGLKRAQKLMEALVKSDFNQGRFVIISKGAKEPAALGKKEQDQGLNRRVEVLSVPKL
ncbi:MAG: OmpA family protein [SAR324 cluster bacterium]|nr:OmpA family protein [SAR324 cluster bacterium]